MQTWAYWNKYKHSLNMNLYDIGLYFYSFILEIILRSKLYQKYKIENDTMFLKLLFIFFILNAFYLPFIFINIYLFL